MPINRKAAIPLFLAGVVALASLTACSSSKPAGTAGGQAGPDQDVPNLSSKYADQIRNGLTNVANSCAGAATATAGCAGSIASMDATLLQIQAELEASPTKHPSLVAAIKRADQDAQRYTSLNCAAGGDQVQCGSAEVMFFNDVNQVTNALSLA